MPVLHRSAALAALSAVRTTAAVAGTHGKTTTSALLATILAGAGRDPGWVVGAGIPHLGRARRGAGTGRWWSRPTRATARSSRSAATWRVVTNVEPDHLENWGGEEALRDGFRRFVAGVAGPVVLCADDPGSAALVPEAGRPVTYGLDAAADYRVVDPAPWETGVRFTLAQGGEEVAVLVPAAPGVHNARNAAGALAVAHRARRPAGRRRRRARRVPGRGPALRAARRGRRGDGGGQLRPPAHRGGGGPGRGGVGAVAAGGGGVPAPPLQPHGRAVAHVRRLLRRRRPAGGDRHLRRGRGAPCRG